MRGSRSDTAAQQHDHRDQPLLLRRHGSFGRNPIARTVWRHRSVQLLRSSQRHIFKTVPYIVASYTDGPEPAAYSIPDSTHARTGATNDELYPTTASTFALSLQ